jgi:hypothetical protein
VRRVGETRTRAVNVRVLAATNRDLLADVHAARFRQDLYYRLRRLTPFRPPVRFAPRRVGTRLTQPRRCARPGEIGPKRRNNWASAPQRCIENSSRNGDSVVISIPQMRRPFPSFGVLDAGNGSEMHTTVIGHDILYGRSA